MVLIRRLKKMKKHLSLNERFNIENSLCKGISFKEIGRIIGKDCTTISREIRNHYIVKNTGGIGRKFNNCIYRSTCENRGKNCNIKNCIEFVEERCSILNKPPYVCNGCKRRTQCTLSKRFYDAYHANEEYIDTLKETRSGVVIDQSEIDYLNSILTPLIKVQGQSIHHAVINNKNKIMHSENKIYKLIDLELLEVRNIDLPKKVRFRNRTKTPTIS